MAHARCICIHIQARSGHRLKYVRHLALAARTRGAKTILVAPPGTLGSPEMISHLGDLSESIQVIEAETRSVMDVIRIADGVACDRLVLLDGDRFLPRLAFDPRLCASYDVRVLVMRTSVPRSGRACAKAAKAFVKRIAMWIINRSS